MKVQNNPQLHLTYCLNIHPGQNWSENFTAIKDYALGVRDMVCPGQPFALGLRLSNIAAQELKEKEKLEEFKNFLTSENLYVFTINGFPYGQFHQTAVKENVYKPDWQSQQRRDYTIALADILAELLPPTITGSISTVPLSYKNWKKSENDISEMINNLADTAAHLNRIHETTDKDICIGLEPEPDCVIENTNETIKFFSGPLLEIGSNYLQQRAGIKIENAKQILKRHIGICFDTAHLAVQFENLAESFGKLQQADIRICKVQLSSALKLNRSKEALQQLKQFDDKVYLHQVKIKTKDNIISCCDLPEAMESKACPDEKWRIHFHVPLFFKQSGLLQSTSDCLDDNFFDLLTKGATEHLEIETYTFDVLPQSMRDKNVVEAIAEEYKWALSRLKK
ncbi:MAG: TIM barrel protein [Planctomycetes bacterium]|nr:TIM barrel protein [Planctomycetota bacterium]